MMYTVTPRHIPTLCVYCGRNEATLPQPNSSAINLCLCSKCYGDKKYGKKPKHQIIFQQSVEVRDDAIQIL